MSDGRLEGIVLKDRTSTYRDGADRLHEIKVSHGMNATRGGSTVDSGVRKEKRMDDHPALRALEPDEEIYLQAQAGDKVVIVTNRRLVLGSQERLSLNVPLDNLRRIEFDIERSRPATLVIVPEQPTDEPQVLVVQPTEYEAVAQALVVLGRRLAIHVV